MMGRGVLWNIMKQREEAVMPKTDFTDEDGLKLSENLEEKFAELN